jgi:hypothetical protein
VLLEFNAARLDVFSSIFCRALHEGARKKSKGLKGFAFEVSELEKRVWQRERAEERGRGRGWQKQQVLKGRRLKERMLGGRSSVCDLLPPLPPSEDVIVID